MLTRDIIKSVVCKVRSDIIKVEGTTDGLCYQASIRVMDLLKRLTAVSAINYNIELQHGEIAHNTNALSKYWWHEHTWVKVSSVKETWYIDPTCGQFEYVFGKMPDYYISKYEPIWYLNDRDNLRYKKYIKMFPLLYNIVDWFQFKLKGSVSDFIRIFRSNDRWVV